MSNSKRFIEAFCDFMSDAEGLTTEEIIDDLEYEGIDVAKLRRRALDTVRQCSDQERLSWRKHASDKLQLFRDKLKSKISTLDPNNLKYKINELFASNSTEAYFRKIESLSDEDLQSLMEDLHDLSLMDDLEDNSNE